MHGGTVDLKQLFDPDRFCRRRSNVLVCTYGGFPSLHNVKQVGRLKSIRKQCVISMCVKNWNSINTNASWTNKLRDQRYLILPAMPSRNQNPQHYSPCELGSPSFPNASFPRSMQSQALIASELDSRFEADNLLLVFGICIGKNSVFSLGSTLASFRLM